MAPFKFTQAILKGETIKVYNYGKHRRDFTYIDDIVEGVIRVLDQPAQANPDWDAFNPDSATSSAPWRVYNIGGHRLTGLMDFIGSLESSLGITAEKEFLPMQPGDVPDTYADVEDLVADFNYQPKISVSEVVQRFVAWYRDFYGV
ncbi:NAD-dependent epimerase/dehydratase family protein [Marinospirillum celere]|uniref:NAD-dependent epimerase/dehydratase family protein n=1 Tax=Marinospirillum celere TaxID=1122252 RepID=UPI0026AE34A1